MTPQEEQQLWHKQAAHLTDEALDICLWIQGNVAERFVWTLKGMAHFSHHLAKENYGEIRNRHGTKFLKAVCLYFQQHGDSRARIIFQTLNTKQ